MGRRRDNVHWARVRDLYDQLGSFRKVADVVGMSKTGVEHILRTSGHPRLPRTRKGAASSSRQRIVPDSPSARVRDSVLMHNLYVVQRWSLTKIGRHLGVKGNTVLTGLRQLGIPTRSISDALRNVPRPGSQGSRHRDWRGGVAGVRHRARKRLNQAFVRPVLERDQFRCQMCRSRRELVVHHMRAFNEIVCSIRTRYPDLDDESCIAAVIAAHRLQDGITLCRSCHKSLHARYGV